MQDKVMKTILKCISAVASLVSASVFTGCINQQVVLTEEPPSEEIVMRITATLPDENADTRLSYYESGKALKAYWSEEDVLIANGIPSNEDYVYRFELTEGAGTGTGVFECQSKTTDFPPSSLSTNAWTIYFPGSTIICEEDYLKHSYTGQVQRGNGNTDHLKSYHSIRLLCTDGSSQIPFEDAFIDFSGEGYEESSCMKLSLSGFPSSITPTEVSLKYKAPDSRNSSCFYTYNVIDRYWGSYPPDPASSDRISLRLEDFEPCTSIKAYIMMSNHPVTLDAGGTLTISVKSTGGKIYTCTKTLTSDATLEGGRLHSISGTTWTERDFLNIDGFDNPEDGIVVLQEAATGSGTDIIIMGDGFSSTHFGADGNYDQVMRKAYQDFFSVEPYASLKSYFNVYYINAVSEEDHDAVPSANGATQGDASTVFSTEFTHNSTSISGDNNAVKSYAEQAIRFKGGKGGTACSTEDEVTSRADRALMIVMVNVACHAGTCALAWTEDPVKDYAYAYSIAYTALNTTDEKRRWTMIHEAGGHGFGKLADEYEGYQYNTFSTSEWSYLAAMHEYGVSRNINEHWTPEEEAKWNNIHWQHTNASNVYWSGLLSESLDYDTSEGLGIYKGANSFIHMYCRATENSIMRDQFGTDGQFFNAISRWAIWYRLMRMTGMISSGTFKDSLSGFISFDNTLTITKNAAPPETRSGIMDEIMPLAPPVMLKGHWEDGRFKTDDQTILSD